MSQADFRIERPSQLHLGDRPEYIQAFQTLTLDERLAAGKNARSQAPRASHADWKVAQDGRDPVEILEAQNQGRMPAYVPIRWGRMLASPFAFLRGSAAVMAYDLSRTPCSGILVQASGDAHLANFGIFASQERNLIFGINDFDETLPGPWEWDVKRLAASIVVAGRHVGLSQGVYRGAAFAALRTYRKHMWDYARMGYLELFYTQINSAAILKALPDKIRSNAQEIFSKARRRNNLQVLEKQTELIDGSFRIVEAAPLVVHPHERMADGRTFVEAIRDWFWAYGATLNEDRRELLRRYQVVDVALKVVGVGSVGNRCYVALLRGQGDDDPLFLQVKQAQASVLERYLEPSAYATQGQRVVAGQRLIQAAPDIFLGWYTYQNQQTGGTIDFYVRQLRDMKGSVEFNPGGWRNGFTEYGALCGWALALAHARSADPAMIAGYLGDNAKFDEAVVQFATVYADQTERDYQVLIDAEKNGRIQAERGL